MLRGELKKEDMKIIWENKRDERILENFKYEERKEEIREPKIWSERRIWMTNGVISNFDFCKNAYSIDDKEESVSKTLGKRLIWVKLWNVSN